MKTVVRMLVLLSLLSGTSASADTICHGQGKQLSDEFEFEIKDIEKVLKKERRAPYVNKEYIENLSDFDKKILDRIKCQEFSDGVNEYTGKRLAPIVFTQKIDLVSHSSKVRVLEGYERKNKRPNLEKSFVGQSVFGDVARVSIKHIGGDKAYVSIELHMCEYIYKDLSTGEKRSPVDYNNSKISLLSEPEIATRYISRVGVINYLDVSLNDKENEGYVWNTTFYSYDEHLEKAWEFFEDEWKEGLELLETPIEEIEQVLELELDN